MNHGASVRIILGPGLAPGLAGLGVLSEFARSLRIVDVIGVHTGALAAALWATESDLSMAARVIAHLPWAQASCDDPRIVDDPLLEALQLLTRRMTFDQASRRCGVVLHRLDQESAAVVRTGRIAPAVRAALSVPGLIRPLEEGSSAVHADAGAGWSRTVAQECGLDDGVTTVWAHISSCCVGRGRAPLCQEAGRDEWPQTGTFAAGAETLAAYIARSWLAATLPPGSESMVYRCASIEERADLGTSTLLTFDQAEGWFAVGQTAARAWLRRREERQG